MDQQILIACLQHLCGSALDWYRSYLADRHFSVSGFESSPAPLGFHKGQFLGPCFFLYTYFLWVLFLEGMLSLSTLMLTARYTVCIFKAEGGLLNQTTSDMPQRH